MGIDYSVSHAAVLAAQLPPHSRTAIARDPDAAWSDETSFLSAIEYELRYFMHMFSKDGSTGANRPKPVERPSERKRRAEKLAHYKEEKERVDRILGIRPD